jgi:cytidyltransferase-like protein
VSKGIDEYDMRGKKVFVSGCFDLLHSGHVAFFEEASELGDLYVGLGSDKTVFDLKGRLPVNNEKERRYMVSSLKFVKEAIINSGSGILDFVPELKSLKPDILFVNEDGHSLEKEKLCRSLGIEYHISKRKPKDDLPARSTTALRSECRIPYRIDLAGGWLDQPYVSKFYPGPVITISIEPDYDFNDRSGMATSTRKKAIELWQTDLPAGNPEQKAKMLFSYENPPGTKYVSGSQDALGILLPGANCLYYDKGDYWPSVIDTLYDEETLSWLEKRISLIAIHPRKSDYHVLDKTQITANKAKRLAQAATSLWQALPDKNAEAFGNAMKDSFDAQVSMFPLMMNEAVNDVIEAYRSKCTGYKLSGAGGGGYLVAFSEEPNDREMKIRIRRGI